MRVARYWVREKFTDSEFSAEDDFGCWGWSEESEEEARARSITTTRRFLDYWRGRGGKRLSDWRGEYAYFDRPAREEIVQEFPDSSGETAAFVSRNGYGSLVLNTRDLMFIDIDLPRRRTSLADMLPGFLRRWFGGAEPRSEPAASPEGEIQQRIDQWRQTQPSMSLRVYRTAAGFRVMIVNEAIDSKSDFAERVLSEFQSDPLYRKLCRAQGCFRARLSPKPWRLGLPSPSRKFPFMETGHEQEFLAWRREYEAAAEGFATCRLVNEFGPGEIAQPLAPLVHLHDELTRCHSTAPLA